MANQRLKNDPNEVFSSVASAKMVDVQRKTFTRWCNSFLKSKEIVITDLEKDLQTGVNLHALLECVSGETLRKINPKARMQVQYVENIHVSLKFIAQKGIKLVGIGAEDIEQGKTKLVLGMIWMLVLRFQINMGDTEEGLGFRNDLLAWCNRVLNPQGIHVKNFTSDWSSGRAFLGLVNVLQPKHVNLDEHPPENNIANLTKAFKDSEELFDFAQLLDPQDVATDPDDISTMTYVSYFKHWLATKGAVAEYSYAEGEGLTHGESNTPAHFKIFTRNAQNEVCKYGGANLSITLKNGAGEEVCPVEIKDHLDGTYDCHYECPLPGKYKLDINISRKPIKDAPFHPVIEPGEPEPSKCIAEGPGLSQATSGETAHFTIIARDTDKNRINKGGASFSAVLESEGGHIPVTIVDNKDGTYAASYVPVKAGHNVPLQVRLSTKGYGEGPIEGSAFKVHVKPGKGSADHTIAFGPGTKGAKSGEVAPITVEVRDLNDNRVTTGGQDLKGVLTYKGDGPAEPVDVKVKDNGDGTYALEYLPKKAGTYQLDVTLDGSPVKDSPFTIVVGAGKFDLSSFSWDGLELDANGKRVVVAGKTDSFTITARDNFGNQIPEGGLPVAGTIKGKSPVKVEVNDAQNGSYTLSYTPTVAAEYTLAVQVGGQDLGGAKNPFPLLVVPAAGSPPNSFASGEAISNAGVGQDNSFAVTVCDRFDNRLTLGGAKLGGFLTMGDVKIPIEVHDNEDGSYKCSFPKVKKAGNYSLLPTLDDQPIKDAPFNVTVAPGGFLLDNTEVTFPEESICGLPGPRVALKDAEQNLLFGRREHVYADLLPLDEIEVAAIPNPDGTFNVIYPPHVHGDFDMTIFVNGVDTKKGNSVSVKPQPLNPSVASAAQAILPQSGSILAKLLANATPEDTQRILDELRSVLH